MKRYLFDSVDDIFDRIMHAASVLLLLDYDGTIVPIRTNPSLATLSPRTKCALTTLARVPGITVGIISGRPLSELKRLVGVKGLWYAGNHGFEVFQGGKVWVHPELKLFTSALKKVTGEVKRATKNIKRLFIEDKKVTLSIHYRNVTGTSPQNIVRLLKKLLEPYQGLFTLTRGKKVCELRPLIAWDKGKVVELFSQATGTTGAPLRIYSGDDRTDEDAFKILTGKNDISIRVGYKKNSHAQYFCRHSGELIGFLEKIIQIKKDS